MPRQLTALHQTQEVIHFAAAVAVVDGHPAGIDMLIVQDSGMALAGAVGGIAVGAYRRPGRLAGPGRGRSPISSSGVT